MSFTNPAPFGGYVTGDLIAEDEINYWCSVLPDAIDGAAGGTYTLTNPLIIDGDDVTIGEDFAVEGNATLGTNGSDVLTINATSSIVGDVIAAGAATFNGAVAVNSTSAFAGTATFNGNVALGNASSDTLAITASLTTPLGYSGTGRILETVTQLTASGSVDTSAFRNIQLGTSAAAQTLTLTATGVVNGDWFAISNVSGNSWNIAGLITQTIADGEVLKYFRVGGSWTSFYRVD